MRIVDDRPHPGSNDGEAAHFQGAHLRAKEKLTSTRRLPFKIIDARRNDAGALLITAEIDRWRREWLYDDLEAEIRDHPDQYPSLALEMLQDKKKQFLASKDVKGKEMAKANGAALRLVEMAKQGGRAEFFHDVNRIPFARIERNGHHEVKAIREPEFSEWLNELNYDVEGLAPEEATIKRAISTLAILAGRGEERPVFIRHGEHEGAIYYDLCNDQWKAVRVAPSGWSIVEDPPVMFRRYDHMLPQVAPVRGEKDALRELAQLVNTHEEMQALLEVHMVSFLVSGIAPYNGIFLGPHGCTKSTGTSLCKRFADPGTDDREALPSKLNDLDLHLATRSLASYDNASRVTADSSDMLARSSTGGGSTRRALYTNNAQVVRKYRTPFVLNAIALEGGVQADLLDRSIVYDCEPVPDEQRMAEAKVLTKIGYLLPFALAEAFDALSEAMFNHQNIASREGWAPRMKDAYLWMMAIAKALGTSEEDFEARFKQVVQRRDADALEGNPFAVAVEFVARQRGFVGTAAQLHEHLNDPARDIPFQCNIDVRDKQWPKAAESIGKQLPRLITPLRNRGIFIYQCHRNEIDDLFMPLTGLETAKTLDSYYPASRMIVISDHEIKRGDKVEPNGQNGGRTG